MSFEKLIIICAILTILGFYCRYTKNLTCMAGISICAGLLNFMLLILVVTKYNNSVNYFYLAIGNGMFVLGTICGDIQRKIKDTAKMISIEERIKKLEELSK